MDFVYVGSLQVLRSLKVMVISRDADNGFLALITFSAEFTDTDTDTGNLHTPFTQYPATQTSPRYGQDLPWYQNSGFHVNPFKLNRHTQTYKQHENITYSY